MWLLKDRARRLEDYVTRVARLWMYQPSAQPVYYSQFRVLTITIRRMETEDRDRKRKNSAGSKLKKMGQQVKDKAGSVAAAAAGRPHHRFSSRKEKHKSQTSIDPTEIDDWVKW